MLILSQNHSDLSLSQSETPVQLSVAGKGAGEESGSPVYSSDEETHLNNGSMHSQTAGSLSNGSQVSSKASQTEDSHSNGNKVGSKDRVIPPNGSLVDGKGEDSASMNTLSHSDSINTSDYDDVLVENHSPLSASHVRDVVTETPSLTGPIAPLSYSHMDEERGGRKKEEEEVKKKEKEGKKEEEEEEEEAEEEQQEEKEEEEETEEEEAKEEEKEEQEREMQIEAASIASKQQKSSLLSSLPIDQDGK